MSNARNPTMPPKGYKKQHPPDWKPTRKTPRAQNATMYLGTDEMRKRRLEELDRLANEFEVENRSILIQMIADGDLVVKKAKKPK